MALNYCVELMGGFQDKLFLSIERSFKVRLLTENVNINSNDGKIKLQISVSKVNHTFKISFLSHSIANNAILKF